MNLLKKVFLILLCGMLLSLTLCACGKGGEESFQTLDDFSEATIGVMQGSVYDDYAKEFFPNAERKYYQTITDMILSLKQGKIDAFIAENTHVAALSWEGAGVRSFCEPIAQTRAGYIFSKNSEFDSLRAELDEFIIKSRENGFLDELSERWFSDTEPTHEIDLDSLPGERGTINIAISPDLKPISYIKDNAPYGYEIDILYAFAKEYGYAFSPNYMTFDAVLPAISTGRYDIGTGAYTITEERAESINFSESHLTVDVIMVITDEATEEKDFFASVSDSFMKTFIRESRWKLILEGMATTVLISLCAIVLGSAFGFGVYLCTRSTVPQIRSVFRAFAKIYARIIAGTPAVVVLMILFYVVFGQMPSMSGNTVAIIGFALIFGAFVLEHIRVSVDNVDYGQTEAAYALGYTERQAFFHIILPQAMGIFLPSYRAQAVDLIKATAVVGYIAVTDLTKMGDIIRSNTYEAFFPLITTALIYFLLTWLLSLSIDGIGRLFEPKRRSNEQILKGVETR